MFKRIPMFCGQNPQRRNNLKKLKFKEKKENLKRVLKFAQKVGKRFIG